MEAWKKASSNSDNKKAEEEKKETQKHIHSMVHKVDSKTGDEWGQCKCGAVEVLW